MSTNRALAILLTGLGVSVLGDQVYLVALNVWILARTHSPIAVSGLWIAPQLAGLVLGSVLGSLADRWDRRFSLMIANLTSALFIGIIPLTPSVALIYPLIFLASAANALFLAALSPYFKLLVPPHRWARANALRGMLSYGALVMGPALAGVLLTRGTPGMAIWLDAASFFASALALVFLPRLNPASSGETAEAGNRWVQDARTVQVFFRQHGLVFAVIAAFSGIIVFGSAADSQEVVFAFRALHLGRGGYGILVSTAGIGYVAGSAVSFVLGKRLAPRFSLGAGVALSAASYLLYSRSYSFWEAALALVLLGIFQSTANVGFSIFLQQHLPTHLMGRIMGTVRAGQSGLIVAATLAAGFLSHGAGVRAMMTAAASVSVASGLGLSWICLGPGSPARFPQMPGLGPDSTATH